MKNKSTHITQIENGNVGRQRMELTDDYLRRQAKEALKADKILEAKHLQNGALWVEGPNRSKKLIRKN